MKCIQTFKNLREEKAVNERNFVPGLGHCKSNITIL